MKHTILFIYMLLPMALFAQIDRSQAPKPAPAPQIKVGEPVIYTLANGLKVFVVQNTKLPRVSAILTIDRDPILEGDKAGMISMAGSLLRRGTTTMKKAELDEAIDFLGASINTSATSVSAASLKNNFSKTMALMAAVVRKPSLPAEELEKIRKQELSGIQAASDDPSSIASNVMNRLTYGKDHPYGEIETEVSVKNVTATDIKNYFNTYWKPNIAYLVFVGDIVPAEAKKLAELHFGSWQRGNVVKTSYKQPLAPAQTYIALVDRPASVQSVINLVAPIQLKPGAPDDIAASVMNNILGGSFSGRLFNNLREKYGFTYGAYSSLNTDKLVGSFSADASVRNEKTDSAIAQFLYEFNRIRTEALTEDEVSRMKNYLSGSFARSLESPGTIAGFALNIARYNLPKDYYQNYLKNLAAVDARTVQAMAVKYIQPSNMHIVIVGNAKEVAPGLAKYGAVKYFDVYGNEKAAPTVKKTDASITPETIFRKSIEAQGGAAAIAAIKDVTMTGTASVMGQNLSFSQQYVLPGNFVQAISMGGMALMKQMAKDGSYSSAQQGAEQPLDEEAIEEMKESAALFLESYFLSQAGYTYSMKGIEQVNDKDAYAIEIKSPNGRVFTNFYDVTSSLLVKSIKTQDGGEAGKLLIQTYYNGYQTYNGVQLPVKILVDQGQFKINLEVAEVKVNQGLSVADLK